MSSNTDAETGGRTSGTDASGRTKSDTPDAVRKRQARAAAKNPSATSVGGRGGAESTKGNPLPPSNPIAKMGEPLSPHEAERQLFYAHVGIAKVIRSDVNMADLKEEFEVAGENYAYVANHMWTPLRMVIRFVAPVVLVAALLMIWGAMIAATPWVRSLRDWWANRGQDEPQPPVYQGDGTAPEMSVVDGGNSEPPQQAPAIPKRPVMVRRFGGH